MGYLSHSNTVTMGTLKWMYDVYNCEQEQWVQAQETEMKKNIQPLLSGDTQLGMICKDYYRNNSFCKDSDGNINLWKLYNLFTGANKSSYIDNFLGKSVNAYEFVEQIRFALQQQSTNWFLS